MAVHAVWTHRFRSLLTILGHRHRHHYGGHGCVAAHGPATGSRGVLPGTRPRQYLPLQDLGRPEHGAPQGAQAPAAESRVRGPHQALVQRLGGRCRPRALHSAGGRGESDHGARARLRIGYHQPLGLLLQHGGHLAARFRLRPLFHAGRGAARRPRRHDRLQPGRVSVSRRRTRLAAP